MKMRRIVNMGQSAFTTVQVESTCTWGLRGNALKRTNTRKTHIKKAYFKTIPKRPSFGSHINVQDLLSVKNCLRFMFHYYMFTSMYILSIKLMACLFRLY